MIRYNSRYSSIFGQTRVVSFSLQSIPFQMRWHLHTLSYTILLLFFMHSGVRVSCRKMYAEKTKQNRANESERSEENGWTGYKRHSNTANPMHITAVIHISIVWCFSRAQAKMININGAKASFFFWRIPYLRMFLCCCCCCWWTSFSSYFSFLFTKAMWLLFRDTDFMLNGGTGISYRGFRHTWQCILCNILPIYV